MENVILGLLIIQNMTLYEMNRAFKQSISMFYSASYGSLQTALKCLLSKGLVTFEERVDKGRNRKVYQITPAGREEFFQWMSSETPMSKLEVTGLSKVFFLGLIPQVEVRKSIVGELVEKIHFMEADLARLDEVIQSFPVPESQQEIVYYSRKTLDYGRGAHAFARVWFESLLRELGEN